MVMNSTNSLFERGGLQQDTGVISERWGQDGSKLLNLRAHTITASVTVYTVTAGKTVYINYIYFSGASSEAAGDAITIKDGATVLMTINLNSYVGGSIIELNFPTPLKFETSVALGEVGTLNSPEVVMSGWEE